MPPEKTYGHTLVFVLQASSIKSNHTEVKCMCSKSLENQGLEPVSEDYLVLQNTVYHHLFEMR